MSSVFAGAEEFSGFFRAGRAGQNPTAQVGSLGLVIPAGRGVHFGLLSDCHQLVSGLVWTTRH